MCSSNIILTHYEAYQFTQVFILCCSPFSGPDETSMSSISSDKMPKSEVDGSESSQPIRQETSRSVYECEDPEDDYLSDYNISDDEFTPSRRKKRKEPPAKKVLE